MKTELEKCLDGEIFECHDPVFLEFKAKTRRLLKQYNSLEYDQKAEKRAILKDMFGSVGDHVSVGIPFLCDYGCNIHLGDHISINMNVSMMDNNKITIGDHVLIAPNVQIYTATHPIDVKDRIREDSQSEFATLTCETYALPVSIGNGCWIGGGVIILPGVTIGDGTVIGAGSVVTKDIPANCVAVGNPCKVIRKINLT